MAKVGRPPKYKSASEIKGKIDDYFKECEGQILTDDDGNAVLYKGEPVYINRKPPTVTGLALALGFNGRQDMLNYQEKREFCDTITRAKSRCEAYSEERLYDRDGAKGAEFSLRCNFKWYGNPDLKDADSLECLDNVLNELKGKMKDD